MKKLRRSRTAKFISGLLIIFLCAVVILNTIGAVILMEENLYYASKEQFQQKVYLYLYNYTASDLMKYLDTVEDINCNNDNYKNYHNSEIELYRSKYSSEKSNIYFEIRDEQGNLLLKNENSISEPFFTFSSYFSTDNFNSYDMWYSDSKMHYETVDITSITDYTETTIRDEVMTVPESDSFTDNTSNIEPTTEQIDSSDKNNRVKYKTEALYVENINSGMNTLLEYKYTDDLNDKILAYCKNELRYLPFDITYITFYQEDYSYNSVNGEIHEAYSANDDAVAEKSFTTQLNANGKTADITYSYNGSFYINEFSDRLSLTSLILQNSESDTVSAIYRQKNRIQIEVRIDIPYITSVNDIYGIAEKFVDFAIVYRDNIILFTIIDLILLVAAFFFLFYSAGYIPKHIAPVARGLHAIPFDIVIIGCIIIAVILFFMFLSREAFFMAVSVAAALITVLGFSYTTLVRVRAKSLKTNTVIYRVYNAIKLSSEVINESKGTAIKIALLAIIFLTVTAFELLSFLIFDLSSFMITFILFILRIIELPILLLLCVSLLALQNGAKNISKGNVEYRINNPILVGPMKKHAQYLNSINDAVNSAVEERMKSESLKTELITNVSHDLKTPLTSIVNYVDLLKKEDIDSPKAREYINVIDRQSQRLKKLTVDIVEASKAATGNVEVNTELLKLNVILLQTNGEYIERLEEKQLSLIQEIPDKDIIINADGRLLWRIIDNLMNNICKYSLPGTRVYLSLYEDGQNAYISFRNISKNPLVVDPKNLTERFVRGDTSRNTEGSGLGLSIANNLTEIMNGALSIVTDGDLFKVTLAFPVENGQ